jgi:hypothetical protein
VVAGVGAGIEAMHLGEEVQVVQPHGRSQRPPSAYRENDTMCNAEYKRYLLDKDARRKEASRAKEAIGAIGGSDITGSSSKQGAKVRGGLEALGVEAAAVGARLNALLTPSPRRTEEFHRVAKLEFVADPRHADADPLVLQGLYITAVKNAIGQEAYDRKRAGEKEGNTFYNQGGSVLALAREFLRGSELARQALKTQLADEREVLGLPTSWSADVTRRLQENELMLEYIKRSQVRPESLVQMRKMRGAHNEVTIKSEIIRWLAQHKSNGLASFQVHAGAHYKRRERAEQALNWAYTGLSMTDIPSFCSADTSSRNDKAIHAHMQECLAGILDGVCPFIQWDEGSKRKVTACNAQLSVPLAGAQLEKWRREWDKIESFVIGKRKQGKGTKAKAGTKEKERGAAAAAGEARVEGDEESQREGGEANGVDGNQIIERLRALLGLTYTKAKSGKAISKCIMGMLEKVGVKMVYFALVDGASTNLGKHKGSVQHLRKMLDGPLLSAIRQQPQRPRSPS